MLGGGEGDLFRTLRGDPSDPDLVVDTHSGVPAAGPVDADPPPSPVLGIAGIAEHSGLAVPLDEEGVARPQSQFFHDDGIDPGHTPSHVAWFGFHDLEYSYGITSPDADRWIRGGDGPGGPVPEVAGVWFRRCGSGGVVPIAHLHDRTGWSSEWGFEFLYNDFPEHVRYGDVLKRDGALTSRLEDHDGSPVWDDVVQCSPVGAL